MINRKTKEIALMELTCCLPRNGDSANSRKFTAYTQLEIALEEKGYKVYLVPFEVFSNGHINKRNKQSILAVLRKFHIKFKNKTFIDLGKIALLCTMSVFYAYQTKDWIDPPLLSP